MADYMPPSGMVDVVFADVAQPDQARIVAINAHNFLKNQGHFVISIKVGPLHTMSGLCPVQVTSVPYQQQESILTLWLA